MVRALEEGINRLKCQYSWVLLNSRSLENWIIAQVTCRSVEVDCKTSEHCFLIARGDCIVR